MTRKTWVLVIASVLVSGILLEGQVFASDEKERKKIVVFDDRVPLGVQQLAVEQSGGTVVHTLSFINALAIELPALNPNQALAFLLNYTVAGVYIVAGVYDDLTVSVLPITPALPGQVPVQETYDWGLVHSGVDVAHQEWPGVQGQGVNVAIVDTGIDCGHLICRCLSMDLTLCLEGYRTAMTTDMGPTSQGLLLRGRITQGSSVRLLWRAL